MTDTTLPQRLRHAYERGQQQRLRSKEQLRQAILRLREAVALAELGLVAEPSELDGVFVRANTEGNTKKPGWWAYVVVQTEATGLRYLVCAGFGQKNDPESLHDCLPELLIDNLDDAIAQLSSYLEAGVYYLGLLRR
jgi:hypothetical protein